MIGPIRPSWGKVDATSPLLAEPEPPAALEVLALAEWWTRALCCAPYAGTLRVMDSVTSPATTRRIRCAFAVGSRFGRMYGTRYAYEPGAATDPSKGSTQDNGLATYAVVASPVDGSEAFAPAVQQGGLVEEVLGGDDTDLSDGVASLLGLEESLDSTIQLLEVQRFAAFSVLVPPSGQSADLETL